MNTDLLSSINILFSQQLDQQATALIDRLAFPVLLQWESESEQFRTGLDRINWWETLFSRTHPLTYERLKKSPSRRANAIALVGQNVWRNLLLLLLDSDRLDRSVWHVGQGNYTAINLADEFGVDQVHVLQHGGRYIKTPTNTYDLASHALVPLNETFIMRPTQLWTVPFQQAVMVQLQNIKTAEQELIWIPTAKRQPFDFEMSNWAINHNNLMENPEDFASPPFLRGDPSLKTDPIIASTESRIDVPSAKAALTTVTIRGRDTLMFDQVKQNQSVKHWRHLLTDELWEPKAIPMTSACMVLDMYMLHASNDGVLRAHPRGNPKSTYHVEDVQSLVPHMTSLYNVVALIHSHDTLEVRHVEKQAEDPFLRFRTIFQTKMVDASHKPLLYGPYVIFRSLDGSWQRVLYDARTVLKEQIKIPFKAAWTIVSIKNANWRSWTVVSRPPQGEEHQEYVLLAGGFVREGSAATKLSLVASCIGCGQWRVMCVEDVKM
jgi:hypothetical protein